MIRSRLKEVVVLGTALAVLATACGDDDAATTTEAPTTTTTAAPTTTTTTMAPPVTSPMMTVTDIPEPLPIEAPEGYELVWNDEFDGPEIDPANWRYDYGGWGWGNGEAQNYTDRERNARIQDGILIIEAHQEQYEGSFYTSARLKSEDLQEFQYGYFEVRAKVPEGKGTWPAFWMLGTAFERNEDNPIESNWPFAGEIDVMEYVGKEPKNTYGTIHGPGYAGAGSLGKWNQLDFFVHEDWHTHAVEWTEDGFRWFFDGEFYGEIGKDLVGDREWVYDQPYFMLLNLALGGNFAGLLDFGLEYPIQFLVDHVRVYQRVDET